MQKKTKTTNARLIILFPCITTLENKFISKYLDLFDFYFLLFESLIDFSSTSSSSFLFFLLILREKKNQKRYFLSNSNSNQ